VPIANRQTQPAGSQEPAGFLLLETFSSEQVFVIARWIAASHNPAMPADAPSGANEFRKRNGVHYTPPALATFLATEMVSQLDMTRSLTVLDPACGDGALLRAFAAALTPEQRRRTTLVGCETDEHALAEAGNALAACDVAGVSLHRRDFLESENGDESGRDDRCCYDVVIANPPYVRTQTLGAERAHRLAKRFELTGRVDLAYAFVRAIRDVLRPGGVLGLLTSNRFLSVKAGAAVRALLRQDFDLRAIYDLGDTRLFSASVLPSVVIATRRQAGAPTDERAGPNYSRIYALAGVDSEGIRRPELLRTLADRSVAGVVQTREGQFRIERGLLASMSDINAVWRLAEPRGDAWLAHVKSAQAATFGDVATVRVGIKTTADEVFVRDDWDTLPEGLRPEAELLRPLITHREAARWTVNARHTSRRVLYPHTTRDGRRAPIELEAFPKAAAYLRSHEERLKRRQYVANVGRRWYEIWVPHDPAAWTMPKIVFPDIAESPRFGLDTSGAIVQGDCYWMTLKPGVDPDWLPIILAVANSSLATTFYDLMFHNKLYAGRRRYMTQYVEQFPLPALQRSETRNVVALVERLCAAPTEHGVIDVEIERLLKRAFELPE
jgi:methylase of polypeptide subunit release factors